jgi:hypothetical protein
MHTAPLQQPVGQVVASQTGLTQRPPLQDVAPQSRQAPPPAPQRDRVEPGMQTPPEQHPAQEAGVH